jgi:hypothetical protein
MRPPDVLGGRCALRFFGLRSISFPSTQCRRFMLGRVHRLVSAAF